MKLYCFNITKSLNLIRGVAGDNYLSVSYKPGKYNRDSLIESFEESLGFLPGLKKPESVYGGSYSHLWVVAVISLKKQDVIDCKLLYEIELLENLTLIHHAYKTHSSGIIA